tara:strand:- start:2179 stop:2400 length:222 start_codon:yes stop_codon:yes gene_type:complete
MIIQINNETDLLTHLREYERIANGQNQETDCMRSFLLFWNQYPVGSQAIINEWIGFRNHHERQKSSKKINKTS